MKILFLIRDLGQGGAQRQLSVLARGLMHRGHEVRVLAWVRTDQEIGLHDQGSLTVHYLEIRRKRSFLSLVGAVQREVAGFKPDVVHGFMPVENIVLSAVGLMTRHSPPTVWGVRAAPVDFSGYRKDLWLLALAQKLLSWAPKLVIANSSRGAGCVPASLWRRRFVVVWNGIDTKRFSMERMAEIRDRLERPSRPELPLIAVVGRLDPFKGLEFLLDALVLLRRQGIGFAVEIIGDGDTDYRNGLIRRAESAGLGEVVKWTTAVREIETVYARAQVLVSPSLTEGFSNVVCEAMACGLSVVATRVGEAEQTMGELGWLVQPADAQALAGAIITALEPGDPDVPLMRCARMRERFSVDALVRNTERHLVALVERH